MKKTLVESQKLIKKFEKEKKDKSDAELLEKGEYEKLLNQTKTELEEKTSALDALTEKHSYATSKLESFADATIAKFVEVHGQDKLDEIKAVV